MPRILDPLLPGIVTPARSGVQVGAVAIDRRSPFIPPSVVGLFPYPPKGGYWDPVIDPNLYPPGGVPGDPVARLVPYPGQTAEVIGPWINVTATNHTFMIRFFFNHQGAPGCGGVTVADVTRVGFECENTGQGTSGTAFRTLGTQQDRPASCTNAGQVFTGICSAQGAAGCQVAAGSAVTTACPGCVPNCPIWIDTFRGGFWSAGTGQRYRRVIRTTVPFAIAGTSLWTMT